METIGFVWICVISGKGNLGGILAPVASVAHVALTLTIERERSIGILDGIVGLDGLYVDEVFVGGEEMSFYAKDTEDLGNFLKKVSHRGMEI